MAMHLSNTFKCYILRLLNAHSMLGRLHFIAPEAMYIAQIKLYAHKKKKKRICYAGRNGGRGAESARGCQQNPLQVTDYLAVVADVERR